MKKTIFLVLLGLLCSVGSVWGADTYYIVSTKSNIPLKAGMTGATTQLLKLDGSTLSATTDISISHDGSEGFYYNSTTATYAAFTSTSNYSTGSGSSRTISGIKLSAGDKLTITLNTKSFSKLDVVYSCGSKDEKKITIAGTEYTTTDKNIHLASISKTFTSSIEISNGSDKDYYLFAILTEPSSAAPSISPASKSFSEGFNATITKGSDNAYVVYTTDGSTPAASEGTATNGTKFTGSSEVIAIATGANKTIKAIGYNSSHENSDEVSVTYTYVDSRPSAPISWSVDSYTAVLGGSNDYPTLTNSVPVAVTYSSSDATIASFADASVYSITLNKKGTTTISATYTDVGSTYKTTVVSYTLNVSNLSAVISKFWKFSDSAWDGFNSTDGWPSDEAVDNLEINGSVSEIRSVTSSAATYSDVTFTKEAKMNAGANKNFHFRIKGNTKVTVYGRANKNDETANTKIYEGSTSGDAVASAAWSSSTTGSKVEYVNADNSEKDIYVCALSKQWDLYGIKVEPIVPVTITTATWASFSSESALDFTGTDVTAYIAKAKDATHVTLSQINKVPAETGIVVYAESAGTYAIPVLSGDADATTGNLLKPNLSAYELPATEGTDPVYYNYTLAVDGDKNPIFKRSTGVGELAAGKAYLQSSVYAAAPSIFRDVNEENNATNIEDLDANEKVTKFIQNGQFFIMRDGVTYDALGRVVR